MKRIVVFTCSAFFGGIIGSQFGGNKISVNDAYLKSGESFTITHVDGEPVSREWKIFSLWSQPDARIEPGLRRVRFSFSEQEGESVEVSYKFLDGLESGVVRSNGNLPSFIVTKI